MNYILDTNILIYLINGNSQIISFFRKISKNNFSISIISRLETLLGLDKTQLSQNYLTNYLDSFVNINVDRDIVQKAIALHDQNKKKLKFKDLIIAATAQEKNATLITADKDFKKIKGLNVELYEV